MFFYSVSESWAALCHGLLDELARVDAEVARVRGVEREAVQQLVAARDADAMAWLGVLATTHRQVELTRRVLTKVRSCLELDAVLDVEALRAAAAAEQDALPPEASVRQLVAALHRAKAPVRILVPLLSCRVAGTEYRSLDRVERADGTALIVAVEDELHVDAELVLEREPHNAVDAAAIRVTTATGRWLGYVPRQDNAVLARLMDADKALVGAVSSIDRHERAGLAIRIEISLVDEVPASQVVQSRLRAAQDY